MRNIVINYGNHYTDKKDIQSVVNVLKNKNLTQGEKILEFENNLSKYFGSKFACSLSSATSGLYLISELLKWKKKDLIFLSPLTFLAGANSVARSGAFPYFIDIDKDTYNIDPNKLEHEIKKNKLKKIKAVIATDYAGAPCDWKALKYLSKKYNFVLINDNCHALGTKYYNDTKYAIKYSDFVVHSYHAVKNFTTGEGGSILTNDKKIFNTLVNLRSHGIHRNKLNLNKKWIYDLKNIGYNFRLTDIQASLGISQLKKLNKFVTRRREIAKIYDKYLNGNRNFILPYVSKNFKSSYHLYPIQINFLKFKKTKENLLKFLFKKKINLQVHYIPTYRFEFYKKNFHYNVKSFPITEKFYKNAFSLPIFYDLKKIDQMKVIKNIFKFLKK